MTVAWRGWIRVLYKPVKQQVWTHYGSGTGGRWWAGGSTFVREITSQPPSWKCVIKSKIRLRLSMHIYLKNNQGKFHCDQIWNIGGYGFFEEVAETATKMTTGKHWKAIWDQFMVQHCTLSNIQIQYWKRYFSAQRTQTAQARHYKSWNLENIR